MEKLLKDLNEAQKQAVIHTQGASMVLAGAGSGKTRVLTYRVAYLIHEGVDPFRILALTFTNKAAREMKERITNLVGPEARNVWMGTFHSVFSRVLRIDGYRLGYTPSLQSTIRKIQKGPSEISSRKWTSTQRFTSRVISCTASLPLKRK